jgi:hypothetical protein
MIVSPAAGRRPPEFLLLLCCRWLASSSLFVPDVVVVIVVIAGGGTGLSVGTKPWWKTSWSSSASSRHRRLSSKLRWQPDKAVRRATHPVMQVVRPPATVGQSHHPSSSPGLASVKDLGQRGRRDPVVIVAVIDDENDKDDDCIVEAEQRGGTANLPIGSAATTAAVFLVLVHIGVILSGISVIAGIIGIVALSLSSLLLVLTAFAAAIALASVIPAAIVVAANTAAAAFRGWLVVVSPTPPSVA